MGLLDRKGCHAGHASNLAVCNQCGIHAHSVNVNSDRKILKLDCFQGMTCFEILHSHECKGLWHLQPRVRNISARESTGQRCEHVVRSRSYNVTRSHPMYKKMRVLYGMPAVATRKRRKKSEVVREQQENVADDIINEIEKVAEILVEGTIGVEE